MNVWTFWSELQSCYAFYILPNFIKKYHAEFEIAKMILSSNMPKLANKSEKKMFIREKINLRFASLSKSYNSKMHNER